MIFCGSNLMCLDGVQHSEDSSRCNFASRGNASETAEKRGAYMSCSRKGFQIHRGRTQFDLASINFVQELKQGLFDEEMGKVDFASAIVPT